MAKSLSSILFKSMRRLVRKQQVQASKVVKSLLAPPPAPKRRRAAPRTAPAPLFAPLLPLTRAAKPAAVTRRKASSPAPPAKRPRASVTPRDVRDAANRPVVAGFPYQMPARGSWTRGVFEPADTGIGPQRDMHYWLYWPSNAPATRRPLVVMLHGCGQTATEFAQGTRMNELAQRKGFAVLYPQQSVTTETSRCWRWYDELNQHGGGDTKTIRDLIASVLDERAVDRGRVYVAGMSAGAAMAQILALRNPEMIAAVGMHSGPVFGTADSAASAFAVMQHGDATRLERVLVPIARAAAGPLLIPALLIHGDCDKVVRPVNLMQVARQFAWINGLEGEAAHPVLHDYPPRVRGAHPRHGHRTLSYVEGGKPRIVVCQVTGLEHAWSGGVGGLRFNSAAGPDASLMFWNFFARQRRSAAARAQREVRQEAAA